MARPEQIDNVICQSAVHLDLSVHHPIDIRTEETTSVCNLGPSSDLSGETIHVVLVLPTLDGSIDLNGHIAIQIPSPFPPFLDVSSLLSATLFFVNIKEEENMF